MRPRPVLPLAALTALALAAPAAFAGPLDEFQMPAGSQPSGVAKGPDGNVWVTGYSTNQIIRVTPGGEVTPYSAFFTPQSPHQIAATGDGHLWFTNVKAGATKVGEIDPANGTVAEHDVTEQTFDVVSGPPGDGRVYFTGYVEDNLIAVAHPGFATQEVPVPGAPNSAPYGITVGPDGNLWFVMNGRNKVGRINRALTPGTFQEFGDGIPADSGLREITTGPDGNLWAVGGGSGKPGLIARVTPAGVITAFTPATPGSYPSGATAGPDGNVWVGLYGAAKVARVQPDGTITEFPLPTGRRPLDLTVGGDGRLWIADQNVASNKLMRLPADLAPIATTGDATTISTINATLKGTVDTRTLLSKVSFEYGRGTDYGQRTPDQDLAGGEGAADVTAVLTALDPATTYHYRVRSSNEFGTTVGPDREFTTASLAPPPAVPTDRDADGIPLPADCDDGNPAIRPGAQDPPGDGIDQDCATGDAPFPRLGAEIGLQSLAYPKYTRLSRLRITALVGGETVRVTCSGKAPKGSSRKKHGCPFKTRSSAAKLSSIKFDSVFKTRRLAPGTRITVTVTKPGTIGRSLTIVIRKGKAPKTTKSCVNPGSTTVGTCPAG